VADVPKPPTTRPVPEFRAATTSRFPNLHVDADELDDLVHDHGQGAEWRPAVRCPCARLETRLASSACKACRGLGYYYPANKREPIIVLLSSRQPKREDLAAGRVVRGDVQATFPVGIRPAPGDMVLPDEETHTVSEVIYRRHQQIRPAGFDDRRVLPAATLPAVTSRKDVPELQPVQAEPDGDRLIYGDGVVIESIWYFPRGRNHSEPVEARAGSDYDLVGNEIRWRPGQGPEPGEGYTVRYQAPAAYIVEYDPALYRQEAGTRYPFRCAMHRLDKWGERDLR